MPLATLAPATAPTLLSTQEQIGYDLGWDHAHRALDLPAPCLTEPTSLRAGWLAGRAVFGPRTLPPSRAVRMWLQLRLHAWLHGRSVELFQVTPHYLRQLEAGHCPIARVAFRDDSILDGDAVFSRVRSDAAYAAGNLALLSAKANYASPHAAWRDALRVAQQLDAGLQSGVCGLNANQWSRLAVLRSFVEPMPHEQACELPMWVLPPNRLRLFNPAQALQALVSRQLLVAGWSLRISRIEALVPGKAARHTFQMFFHALLPRVLEAGRNISAHELRWAIEDAWRHPLVLQRWSTFARQLSAIQCEALVLRAHAKRLGHGAAHEVNASLATEGWNLESGGNLAPGGSRCRSPGRARGSAARTSPDFALPAVPSRQTVLPLH